MKSVSSWSHLEPFGLVFLTGEADFLSHRLLFDCTEEGKKLLACAFGVASIQLAEPWNGRSSAGKHVGSILLPQRLFPSLAIFALLESGHPEVILCRNGTVIGFEPDDTEDERQQTRRLLKNDFVRSFAYGRNRDRNLHQMSGRTT